MSTPVFEIDESEWQKYLVACQAEELHPSMSDFLIWREENGLDKPELYDGEWGQDYER